MSTDTTDSVNLTDIPTLDVSTLTFGELEDLERETGRSADKLLVSGRATLRLLALWLADRRSSEKPRSWQELRSLRVFGAPSSTSPSSPDGPQEKSAD